MTIYEEELARLISETDIDSPLFAELQREARELERRRDIEILQGERNGTN